jgi:hypothetical protein
MAISVGDGSGSAGRSLRTFFLVGGPRCGTTFLSKVLARHPEVCFSKPKETFYFLRDPAGRSTEAIRREFLTRYFGHLTPAHRILGEGSPMHLYATELIERLLAFDPETRFIASVRSPLQMAPSYHGRLLYTLDEDVKDFEEAWSLQEARARGERIPRRCRDPRLLLYQEACSLGHQVENLFKVAGRERCHVVVFDDLSREPERVYRSSASWRTRRGRLPDGWISRSASAGAARAGCAPSGDASSATTRAGPSVRSSPWRCAPAFGRSSPRTWISSPRSSAGTWGIGSTRTPGPLRLQAPRRPAAQGRPAPGTSTSVTSMRPVRAWVCFGSESAAVHTRRWRRSGPPSMHAKA